MENFATAVYISVGIICLAIFVTITMFIIVKVFRGDKTRNIHMQSQSFFRCEIPLRKPNVIYSEKFIENIGPTNTPRASCLAKAASIENHPGHTFSRSVSRRLCLDLHCRICLLSKLKRHAQLRLKRPSEYKTSLLEQVHELDDDEEIIDNEKVLEGEDDYCEEEEEVQIVSSDDEDVDEMFLASIVPESSMPLYVSKINIPD